MLSEELKQKIHKRTAHYAQKQAVLPEALKLAQNERGWVSDQDVQDIADFLGLTPEEVDGVATFYNLVYRRPVGRHVILLCDSISCWMLGHEHLLEHLRDHLGIGFGETTPDGRFTLLPTACLGACDQAPAMMVDADLYTRLTPGLIDETLERYT